MGERLGRAAAWAVHAFTASGAVLALLAIVAVVEGRYRLAFAWLALQVFVDSVDGWLARRARVHERLPAFSGAHLDDLVDYLTYVFLPAFMVWHAALVPDGVRLVVPAAMILSSAFGFSRLDAKTDDHYFTGFPSYWNIVVFYLIVLGTPALFNAVVLLALAALVFVPIKYIYPSRTVPFMATTLVLGASWGAAMLVTLWSMPGTPRALLAFDLVFPAYYTAVSLWLEARRRTARRVAPVAAGAPGPR